MTARPFTNVVEHVGTRIRLRLAQTGMKQADLARATGISTQRLGNYVSGTRPPDLLSLTRIARVLGVTTDYLLGLSDAVANDCQAVILRLLELDGMPPARAKVIAEAAASALRLLPSLPDATDAQTRAHLAAQAVWNLRPPLRPN